jgi:hypothetical protein
MSEEPRRSERTGRGTRTSRRYISQERLTPVVTPGRPRLRNGTPTPEEETKEERVNRLQQDRRRSASTPAPRGRRQLETGETPEGESKEERARRLRCKRTRIAALPPPPALDLD